MYIQSLTISTLSLFFFVLLEFSYLSTYLVVLIFSFPVKRLPKVCVQRTLGNFWVGNILASQAVHGHRHLFLFLYGL